MRIAFLISAPDPLGAAGVVAGHVQRLRDDHGVDAVLAPFADLDAVRGERWDLAVAGAWEAVAALETLDAPRHAYLVQAMDDRRHTPGSAECAAAAATYEQPIAMIAQARWIVEQLEALRDGATVQHVRTGIDKEVFAVPDASAPDTGGPLRVLVEGRPGVRLDGVDDALAAAAAMREPAHVTLVCADPAATTAAPVAERLGPLTAPEMADLYARTDVVLDLARVAGMARPPLEGFHRGATCVTTPVTGHDEYVEDGRNALLTSFDDERGTSRLLDLVARDRGLLRDLRAGALRTARAWPSVQESTAMLLHALQRIAAAPPPAPAAPAPGLGAPR